MPNQKDIKNQRALLAVYRRNLAQLEHRAALGGGEAFAPPDIANGLYETREKIRQIEALLRDWGVEVEALPDDQDHNTLFQVPAERRMSPPLILIGALLLGLVVVGLVFYGGARTAARKVAVRVARSDGRSVARASVVLFYGGETPQTVTTDANGIATFAVNTPTSSAQLVAQADGFEVHEEKIDLAQGRDVTLILRPLDADVRPVIIRVVNKASLQPAIGAEVTLIVGGQVYTDAADQNGLVKYRITFSGDTLDASITVNASGKQINNQIITLRPNQLQSILLDDLQQRIEVGPVDQ